MSNDGSQQPESRFLFSKLTDELFNRIIRENDRIHRGAIKLSDRRHKIVRDFIDDYKSTCNTNDLYPILRLILPKADRARAPYFVKETNYCKLLIQIFNLDENSEDAKRMKNFTKSGNKYHGGFVGQLAEVVKEVRLKRETNHSKSSNLSIKDINDLLDEFARASNQAQNEQENEGNSGKRASHRQWERQAAVLRKFLDHGFNSDEWKWLTQIILKNTQFKMAEKSFLNSLHRNAYDFFSANNDIKAVAENLKDTRKLELNEKAEIKPMNMFMPQMALNKKNKESETAFESIANLLNANGMYVEDKLDGNRIQAHVTSKTTTEWLTGFDVTFGIGGIEGLKPEETFQNVPKFKLESDKTTTKKSVSAKRDHQNNNKNIIKDGDKTLYKVYDRKFGFWTRGNVHVPVFGEASNQGWIAPSLHEMLPPYVYDAIFDGEVIAFDPVTQKAGEYSDVASYRSRYPNNEEILIGRGPKFLIFDILYLNGKDLRDLPLYARKGMLLNLFTQSRHFFKRMSLKLTQQLKKTDSGYKDEDIANQISSPLNRLDIMPFIGSGTIDDTIDLNDPLGFKLLPSKYTFNRIPDLLKPIPSDSKYLENKMEEVIVESSEGLVVKDPMAKYILNSREYGGWYKLKPEYVNTMEDVDLLVVGVTYGQGNRAGKLASFLLAAREGDEYRFSTCVRVGGGFTFNQLDELTARLKDKGIIDFDRINPPQWLKIPQYAKADKLPHFLIRPEDSLVMQIRAAEIIDSREFACGLTFRHPRFVQIREDRSYSDCDSVARLKNLKEKTVKSLHDQAGNGNNNATKKRNVKARKIKFKTTQSVVKSNVEQETNALQGQQFVLCDHTEQQKVQLADIIKKNGGETIAPLNKPGENVVYISRNKQARGGAKDELNRGKKVVWRKYIDDCIQAGRLLVIDPTHLIQFNKQDTELTDAGREVVEQVNEACTGSGIPKQRYITVEDFKTIFANMKNEFDDLKVKDLEFVKNTIEKLQKDGFNQYRFLTIMFFMTRVYYLDKDNVDEWVIAKCAAMGAAETQNASECDLIVANGDKTTSKEISEVKMEMNRERGKIAFVVDQRYIIDCFEQETVLPEDMYAL